MASRVAQIPIVQRLVESRITPVARSLVLVAGGAILVLAPVIDLTALAATLLAAWCGFVFAYAFEAHIYHRLRDETAELEPADDRVYGTDPMVLGTPGEHASRLARELGRRVEVPWRPSPLSLVTVGAALTVIAALGNTLVWASSAVLLMAGWVAGNLDIERVATGRASLRRSMADARARARAGARAERQVGACLERLGTLALVAHGRCLGAGGDVDHIVVGPTLAAIETKSGGGHLTVGSDGRITAGSKTLTGDPVEQAVRQARALSDLMGRRAAPIVCVPRASNTPRQVGRATVCNLAQLPGVLSRLDHVVEPDEIAELVARLQERDRTERAKLAVAARPRPSRSPLRRLADRLARSEA